MNPQKILVLCSCLDLNVELGATPAWWQLLKAFHEEGVSIVTAPYRGRAVRTLWWKSYANPCYYTGEVYSGISQASKKIGVPRRASNNTKGLVPRIASMVVRPRWERHVKHILSEEGDVEAIICLQLPLNQLGGLPTSIKEEYDIPILYYDCDLPVSLPGYGGYTFNAYVGADLTEYDSFIVNSAGAVGSLTEMGAPRVQVVHWGADPSVYFPILAAKDTDVFYSGIGTKFREHWINEMIRVPSQRAPASFLVSGIESKAVGSMVKSIPFLSFSEWIRQCWRSKLNLNIARDSHALTPETSSSRPFELAALGCCIVSNPYIGLSSWFKQGEEIFVVRDSDEASDIYRKLLEDKELRERAGKAARERVLREHTFRHRARQILDHISSLN